MADRLARISDEELARALAGTPIAFPTIDVAATVGDRVRDRRPVRLLPGGRPLRRGVVAAIAAVLLLGGAALAGRLGVPGLRVIFAPSAAPAYVPVGRNLFLGTPSSLWDARPRVSFPVLTPHGRGLGPAAVFVGHEPAGGRVSLVYPARPGLPASRFTHAALLMTEFKASIDQAFVKKLVLTGVRVDDVSVNGSPGIWFSGRPHELAFLAPNGDEFVESVRLAGNTLVWAENGVTIRLECRCSEAMALRIAESLR